MAQVSADFATNPNISPYTWEATKNGVVFAVEYPPGDVPETPFSAIGFTTRLRGDAGREVPTFVNATGETVRMKARSLREASCPMIEIDIAPGDALIWGHRRVHAVQARASGFDGNLDTRSLSYETQLFGRETVAGEVQIAQIWPTGETTGFDSYAAAMTAL
jgi:hypothetical protein